MSVLDTAFSFLGSSQTRAITPGQSAYFDWGGFFSLGNSASGIVTKNDSLKISAFYNGVDQISSDIARIPFKFYTKQDGSSIELPSHPASVLLKNPNSLMTSYISKKLSVTSMIIKGNALWHLKFNAQGYPVSKKWIEWDKVYDVRLSTDGLNLLYYVRGYDQPLLDTEVLHYKGMTLNGLVGVSVVTYAAEQMGLTLKTQAYSVTAMDNKGVRQGVVESDKKIDKTAKQAIIEGVRNAFGQKDPNRVAVLDEGMTWKAINLTAQEIQLIEQQRFNIEDIARWINIPLHKIKSMTAATNNNIEQQAQDYIGDTLAPYVTNIEEENAKKLTTSSEQINIFCKGNLNALMRADMKARSEYYSKMTQSGIYSRNEVRSLEEMNPGPEFLNEHLTPVNTYTQKQLENNIKTISNGSK